MRSKITGVGTYVPPNVWKNEDLKSLMETSDEWITQRTGIKQRYWADQDAATSDLALEASKAAIEKAGLKKEDIDMIILGTLSPDHEFPGTACFLQAKLGVPGIPALDIRQQCTGFIYGMSIADQFIRGGMYRNILVVGAEIHSKGIDRTTRGRDVAVLFGDGAGAVVMSPCEVKDPSRDPHMIASALHADGTYAKELWIPAPGTGLRTRERCERSMLDEGIHYPQMNGKAVFMHAVKRMPEAIMEVCRQADVQVNDIDLFILHQANLRINEAAAKQLGVSQDKVFNTIQDYGNTTAATIPIGLEEAEKAGVLKPGMLVASAAFGSGFTWASALYRW